MLNSVKRRGIDADFIRHLEHGQFVLFTVFGNGVHWRTSLHSIQIRRPKA